MADLTSARIDAWLWAVRVFKTRSAATTACRAGHVRLNGDRAKAAALVRPGDEIRVRTGEGDRERRGRSRRAGGHDRPHSSPGAARRTRERG
jgi:ribosomal 50S subunit-recycling heat shock protein